MTQYIFEPQGVCTKKITLEIEGDIIQMVHFQGGCPGNLIGIKSLVEGQSISTVMEKLDGILCGERSTSCPDQLVKALRQYLAEQTLAEQTVQA